MDREGLTFFDSSANTHLKDGEEVEAAGFWSKVGEVPTFRASDNNTDLPTVSINLFSGFQYLKQPSSLQNVNLYAIQSLQRIKRYLLC